jgi:hypothetical protein
MLNSYSTVNQIWLIQKNDTYHLHRQWKDFDTKEPCPYHFSEEEIQRHQQDAENFKMSQDFWNRLSPILTNEGYTPNDTFPQAVKTLMTLREAGLKNMAGNERNEFDQHTKWILDLKSRI